MGEQQVVSQMRRRPGDAATLDEIFKELGDRAWGSLRDAARANPGSFDDAVIGWIVAHLDDCPRAAFAALLDLAGRDAAGAPALVARYRELMESRPGDALAAAGYNLHEYCRLLDERWVADARRLFDANPEGAWGIVTSAAYYAPKLLTPEIVDWFEARLDAAPVDGFRTLLHLAANDASRRDDLVGRALARFDRHPAAAVEAAQGVAGEEDLLRPDLVSAVLRHLPSNPGKAWEFLGSASYKSGALFDGPLLDALAAHAPSGARTYFSILHRVADADAARAREVMDRYARLLPAHPADGIDEAHYVAANDPHLLSPALVDAVCAHFPTAAYAAYDVLRAALDKRPELLRPYHMEAALRNIEHATNWAFGFFRRVLEVRPEFTPLATLALFECLAHEPENRAPTRIEEMQAIVSIAQASHVRTELERALRQPLHVGSRRARALMAILFRQRSRSKQHVLFESLRLAAKASTWSDINRTPLWDFFMLLLDHSSDDAVSTAAAERFLEGAFQLTYLMDRGADHDSFRLRFDLKHLDEAPWPAAVSFLAEDPDLVRLHRIVVSLGARFDSPPRLPFIREFEERQQNAESEIAGIDRAIAAAEGEKRRRLQKRRESLAARLALWRDPAYTPAPGERRDLAKRALDDLRSELARIAVEGVERARLGLYAAKLEAVLGRRVDVSRLEPSILPAFLFFGTLGQYPNNRKWLGRLIEDRLEDRPHDWLRNEPAVLAWAEEVRKGQPGVLLDRWRARFSKEHAYRPQDAAAERKRRVREDLAQARALLESLGVEGLKDSAYDTLARALVELKMPRETKEGDPPPPDPNVLDEVGMNLERVRIIEQTPESDYEGRITLEVETDPFQVLFMGEYGFASCLSLRGSNVWSAVSNAIDVDKAVVWAKEFAGNVVGRRLVALTPRGIVSYRTYANRHGLALDGMFDDFLAAYARHCGTVVARGGSPGPLLSDRWYDDGAL